MTHDDLATVGEEQVDLSIDVDGGFGRRDDFKGEFRSAEQVAAGSASATRRRDRKETSGRIQVGGSCEVCIRQDRKRAHGPAPQSP